MDTSKRGITSLFRKITLHIVIVGSMVALIACQPVEDTAPTASPLPVETLSPEQTLTLGDISDDPAGTIEDFQPLADYLAAHLADAGIRQGKVVVAPDLETMMHYLETGHVDLYFESPYGALTVYEQVGAIPLLRRWKKGVGEYYTLIVVRNDSGITDLDGLLGQVIAFEDPASTSGYLLPKSYLVGLGYQVSEKGDASAPVADDEIGYIFSGGEENVIAWVLQGKMAGGALPIGNYEALSPEERIQLTILTQTMAVPRHIAMARPGMDEALQTRLIVLLLEMHRAPEGQAVLETFERTSRFDLLPRGPKGTMEALQELFAPVR
jgi:phosphonate transport system substrate-binding protein